MAEHTFGPCVPHSSVRTGYDNEFIKTTEPHVGCVDPGRWAPRRGESTGNLRCVGNSLRLKSRLSATGKQNGLCWKRRSPGEPAGPLATNASAVGMVAIRNKHLDCKVASGKEVLTLLNADRFCCCAAYKYVKLLGSENFCPELSAISTSTTPAG
jgi:hypothetical protein